MELVYLWVEDYKNIHNQGFNFSPRFTCDYNDETNELTIDDNPDYIENFFGNNINVTAIVGKNGSGKSSVLEALYFWNKNFLKNKILIIENNNEFIIYTKINFNEIFNNVNLSFSIDRKEVKDIPYMNISHFHNEKINLTDHNHISVYRNRMYHSEVDGYDEEGITDRYKNFKTEINYFFLFENKLFQYFEKYFNVQKTIYLQIDFLKNTEIKDFSEHRKFTVHDIFYRIFSDKYNEDFENEDYDFDQELWSQFVENYDKKLKVIIDKIISFSIIKENILIIELEKHYQLIVELISSLLKFEKLDYFNIARLNNKKEKLDFSSGEQIILLYLYTISFQKGIFLIDEIDLYLHPKWQKSFLSLILKFTKIKHFILSTHSPFLLSDIPKQNIIFLDKNEDGTCKVVDGLNDKKQTFGANIHTLLSDSFFMEDGLMGEFAKGKIDKAITLLNKDKLDEKELKYCEQIISIIGEPIVKNQLQRMLDSKRLSKIDDINAKIKQMSYELGVLKEHQSQIVQDELRDKGKQRYKERFIDDKNN